jgi:aryl-alcohol dehydrogenase-like predicted oxidoreductase
MSKKTLPKNVILGLWPIAGVTTVGVTDTDARDTIRTALELGIHAFDTAYGYGYDGESDRYLGEAIRARRDECFVIGKVGQRWSSDRKRVIDCSATTLVADAEASLARIGIECFDLLMLHCVDPRVPLEESARAIQSLQSRGCCDRVGVCNADLAQMRRFHECVGCDAIQCPLNMVQPDALAELIPGCREVESGVYVYWTLMKGLLAGKITRDHVFATGDSRPGYPIFQGDARRKVHDLIDKLEPLAKTNGLTLSQLAIGWALSQLGVTGALVGARRPEQVIEVASAQQLEQELLLNVEAILAT